MSLVPVDTSSTVAVTDYLTKARDWLATAVEVTGPEQIAAAKAEIATAAEATKQLGLSKEIQEDAVEMVRRAEYALGKAIRKGQAEGTVRRVGEIGTSHDRWNGVDRPTGNSTKASPSDFASKSELSGVKGGDGIYAIVDNATDDDVFEAALEEARAEGNLSRANVARKVKGVASHETRDERAKSIAAMAAEGYRSTQIAPRVGVSELTVRQIARDYGIRISADEVTRKGRRIDSNRVLSGTADALSAAAFSLQQVNPLDLDQEAAQEWVDSLTESLSAIRKAVNSIKESLRD